MALDPRGGRHYNLNMHVEMVVAGLTVDPVNNTPIVILREKEGTRVLPIWIGVIEASAIAFELESVKLARPMTHDLLKSCIASLGGEVRRAGVVALRDNTYFAELVMVGHDGKEIRLDARPSDAIAVGLRAKAPLFCTEEVLCMAQERQQQATQETDGQPSPMGGEQGNADAASPDASSNERSDDGPLPILIAGDHASWHELLENLSPEDFGKYKM